VHREARHAFDSRDPAIRAALRGIARPHAAPARQAVALTTAEIRALVRTCGPDLAGLRDRALLLLGYAGALRRSELVGVDAEHLRFHSEALEVLLPRSKGDPDGEGQRISIGRGKGRDTCPVRAVEDWLRAAAIRFGPVFRMVSRGQDTKVSPVSGPEERSGIMCPFSRPEIMLSGLPAPRQGCRTPLEGPGNLGIPDLFPLPDTQSTFVS
jgi:integrase